MAENTEIAWCDHTVNFWWGCTKVSPACANCYAEGIDKHFHPAIVAEVRFQDEVATALHWGAHAPRMLRVEAARREAMRYERRAVKEGRRFRVFTNSMSDFFEDHRDLDEARAQALEIILDTPHLDWLILTKRPQSIVHLLRRASKHPRLATRLSGWIDGILKPPTNIWLGTTVEDQRRADERIPALLQVPAAVRFLSCEPLLGPVDLNEIRIKVGTWEILWSVGLDWVICGGESGPKARPMHPEWARGLRDQCATARVPFLFKQWGEWAPNCLCGRQNACPEMKRPEPGKPGCMFRCGKKAAGRLLDGQLHDAFPEVARG